MFETLTIETEKGKKGRSFTVDLLAFVETDILWASTSVKHHRPVWLSVGGPDATVRAFTANLLLGRPAMKGHSKSTWDRYEMLKTAPFAFHYAPVPGGGMLAHIYHRELFDPAPNLVDPGCISFCCLPPTAWCERQVFSPAVLASMSAYTFSNARMTLCEGTLLLRYLERRTRCPFPPHPVFGCRLLEASRRAGILHRSSGLSYERQFLYAQGLSRVGLHTGFSFHAEHASFEAVLQEVVRDWFGEGTHHG